MTEPTMTPRTETVLTHDQPVKVELQRAKDGTYYWNIQLYAATANEVLAVVGDIDTALRSRYLPQPIDPQELPF